MYGTQFQSNFKPFPIENEAYVDERRAKAGLPPLANYIAQMQTALPNQPSPREQISEMNGLISKLPPSPKYEAYLKQMKRLLDMMGNF